MSSTYFFSNIESNKDNELFLKSLEEYACQHALQTYLITSPLAEKKYTYSFDEGMILLIPNHKIILINAGGEEESFEDFFEDFFEDLGHLSDRYEYRKILGRPRKWKSDLLATVNISKFTGINIEDSLFDFRVTDTQEMRQIELLISLCIGSINQINKITEDLPKTLLEKVKQNIILFDADQTRFIFKKKSQKRITIQGLAGTGKTELLLHKIKELYTDDENRIAFTCFNKALAHSLKNRIPSFFDFMKVEEQIKWEERLWVVHSWGSKNDSSNIGMYSLICKKYGIPFKGLNQGSFDSVCKYAIDFLSNIQDEIQPMFDYVFIDESQDFQESFFELCELVTSKTVYVAGDIFQNIFQANTNDSTPDFLLNKCYRTDPRTLMFAHGIGFGLFEEKGIRKLTNEQWVACGYQIEKESSNEMILSREPLRKFKDINYEDIDSIKLISYENSELISKLINTIEEIRAENPTLVPDDIAVVITDKGNKYFDLMEQISITLSAHFNWKTNTLYNTKELKKDTLSISNINNIKGLEFPFVICISHEPIGESIQKRNSLYMTLTRSFITSYLLVSTRNNAEFINKVSIGLNNIKQHKQLRFNIPTQYIDQAELILDVNDVNLSQKDVVDAIFDELGIYDVERQEKLRKIVCVVASESTNQNHIKQIITSNLPNIGVQ